MIRLSKSTIGSQEKNAVLKVLDEEYLGMGNVVKKFEDSLSKFFGRKAICVVNGTASLQLALEGINVKKNDEVLVPSLTYLSCFQAISATGAIPISVDVNEYDLTICIKDLENKINRKSIAIMPMHYSGNPCDLKNIYSLAKKNNLRVIEDAAHAFGSYYKNKLIGSFGDIACFSFDGIKNITSGEGGCIITNNLETIDSILTKRSLGIVSEYKYKYKNKRKWDYDVHVQGWRYHMSNIMAAIGNEQLKKISQIETKRNALALRYNRLFKNHTKIETFYNTELRIIPHIYVIRIHELKNKNKLRQDLLKLGIETGEHYKPNHLLSFFRSSKKLINTENVFKEIITLPLHVDLKLKDVKYVSTNLIEVLKKRKYF